MKESVYIHFLQFLYCFQFRACTGVDNLSLHTKARANGCMATLSFVEVCGNQCPNIPTTFSLPTLTLLVTAHEYKAKDLLGTEEH